MRVFPMQEVIIDRPFCPSQVLLFVLLQHKKRTIIIGIDNRAKEKKKDFNLPVIDREDMRDLAGTINSPLVTDIHIPLENINKWKGQFKE